MHCSNPLSNFKPTLPGAVFSHPVVSGSATPWTVTQQAPPSMGFSRKEHWGGPPCPPPGALTKPGIEPRSPASQVDSLPSEPQGKPNFAFVMVSHCSVGRLCPPLGDLWTAAHRASLSFPISQSLLAHVCWAGDAIQPSHPLSSPSVALLGHGYMIIFQAYLSHDI